MSGFGIGVAASGEAAGAVDQLPAELGKRLRAALALPGHCCVCVWAGAAEAGPETTERAKGGRLLGVALGQARPTGTVLRLLLLWAEPDHEDREAVGCELIRRLEAHSRASGLLCWRATAETLLNVDLGPLVGLSPGGEHWLGNLRAVPTRAVPFYPQSTRFTCGPASLMMGFAALRPDHTPDRRTEIALWREATSIHSLAGPGGCDPLGLALAARSRGFGARVFLSTREPVLMERADTEEKRELIRFVQEEFRTRAREDALPLEERAFDLDDIREALSAGEVVLVLVSQRLTQGRDAPHWILLHGQAGDHFLVSDPWVDPGREEVAADASDVPVPAAALDRMAWYGEPAYRAAVMLSAPA